MAATGEKMCILAEILRASSKGATKEEVSRELGLTRGQTQLYLHFLEDRQLIVRIQKSEFYVPSRKGLSYLRLYDEVADLVDPEPSGYYSGEVSNSHVAVYWDKTEILARMREIIDR